MNKKAAVVLVLTLLLSLAFQAEVFAALFIKDDSLGGDCSSIGKWDASTKTCTLTTNVSDRIFIASDDVTLDGNGHTVDGTDSLNFGIIFGNGFTGVTGVSVKNLIVVNFTQGGILLFNSDSSAVTNNIVSNNDVGVDIAGSNNNTFTNNTISNNNRGPLKIGMNFRCTQAGCSSDNVVVNNNFIGNPTQAKGSGLTTLNNIFYLAPEDGGGNYWSDFDEPGEGCNDTDLDGFCDSGRVVDVNFITIFLKCPNTDNCDLYPWTTQDGWLAPVRPPADDDNDGILDDVDVCLDTVIPEAVPSVRLGVNRFALVDGDGEFDTTSPKGKGPRRSYTIEDTAGCSCEQIIEMGELGLGHTKFGCSISVMDDWVELVNR